MLDAQNGVYSLIGPFNATKGAVTVSVTRGSLTEAMEKDSSFVAATTEPPYNYRSVLSICGIAIKTYADMFVLAHWLLASQRN